MLGLAALVPEIEGAARHEDIDPHRDFIQRVGHDLRFVARDEYGVVNGKRLFVVGFNPGSAAGWPPRSR
jgi:hypothetical protein